MTTKIKVYKIKLPLTLKEWRKGQRYVLTKMTTSEVQIVYHKTEAADEYLITKTHKIIDVRKKIPYVIKKIIPNDAGVVDEFSTNIDSSVIIVTKEGEEPTEEQIYKIKTKLKNEEGVLSEVSAEKVGVVEAENMEDKAKPLENINNEEEKEIKGMHELTIKNEAEGDKPKSPDQPDNAASENHIKEFLGNKFKNSCTTIYKNRYFNPSTFKLEIKTIATQEPADNIFEQEKAPEEDSLDFRTFNKSKLYHVGSRDYTGNWEERYPHINCYKLVHVTVNSFGLGWITSEIDKMLRNLLMEVQQKVIETYDEWADLSNEDIEKLEKEMISKFILKIK